MDLIIAGILLWVAFVVILVDIIPTSDEVEEGNPLPSMYKTGGEWYDK